MLVCFPYFALHCPCPHPLPCDRLAQLKPLPTRVQGTCAGTHDASAARLPCVPLHPLPRVPCASHVPMPLPAAHVPCRRQPLAVALLQACAATAVLYSQPLAALPAPGRHGSRACSLRRASPARRRRASSAAPSLRSSSWHTATCCCSACSCASACTATTATTGGTRSCFRPSSRSWGEAAARPSQQPSHASRPDAAGCGDGVRLRKRRHQKQSAQGGGATSPSHPAAPAPRQHPGQ